MQDVHEAHKKVSDAYQNQVIILLESEGIPYENKYRKSDNDDEQFNQGMKEKIMLDTEKIQDQTEGYRKDDSLPPYDLRYIYRVSFDSHLRFGLLAVVFFLTLRRYSVGVRFVIFLN